MDNEHRSVFADLVTKELNTTRDVADIVGVHENTVRWWQHVGRGPKGFKLAGSRRTYYTRADLIAWMENSYASSQAASA